MTKEEVIQLAEQYMAVQDPVEIEVVFLRDQARFDGTWWNIPVQTNYPIRKLYPYYEKLADTSTRLHDEKHIHVLFIPA